MRRLALRCRVRVVVDLHDVWIGAYWRREYLRAGLWNGEWGQGQLLTFWLCVLPCLPLVVTLRWVRR